MRTVFLDNYAVTPLARKLRECGAFSVSSDKYLNYALEDREKWERKRQIIVAEMLASTPIGKPFKDNFETSSVIMGNQYESRGQGVRAETGDLLFRRERCI